MDALQLSLPATPRWARYEQAASHGRGRHQPGHRSIPSKPPCVPDTAWSGVMKSSIYSGVLAGAGWQWVNLAYLLGGAFLLRQKAIRWHIPVSFLVTGACATLGWVISPESLACPRSSICSPARPCSGPFYSDRSGHRVYHQPRTSDFRRAGWLAGLAYSQLWRLSGRCGICRSAG